MKLIVIVMMCVTGCAAESNASKGPSAPRDNHLDQTPYRENPYSPSTPTPHDPVYRKR